MVQETHPVIKLVSGIALVWHVVFSSITGQNKIPFNFSLAVQQNLLFHVHQV